MPVRKPGSPEWHAHVARMQTEEAREPEQWWYLSFCDPQRPKGTQFLGVCIVRGRGVLTAMQRSHALGLNPGGECASWAIGDQQPPLPVNRLLSKAELGPSKTIEELEAEGMEFRD
jgi:hypothetical protein